MSLSRQVFGHETNPMNSLVSIFAVDKPGHGGANHEYQVVHDEGTWCVNFQNGTLKEAGVNGFTHEILLAILIDRLRGFQDGPYSCRENALALTKLEEGLQWLHERTRKRELLGIEGTHQVG